MLGCTCRGTEQLQQDGSGCLSIVRLGCTCRGTEQLQQDGSGCSSIVMLGCTCRWTEELQQDGSGCSSIVMLGCTCRWTQELHPDGFGCSSWRSSYRFQYLVRISGGTPRTQIRAACSTLHWSTSYSSSSRQLQIAKWVTVVLGLFTCKALFTHLTSAFASSFAVSEWCRKRTCRESTQTHSLRQCLRQH